MYRTIEAIYDNGKVYPVEDMKIKKGRVLLIILEEEAEMTNNVKPFKSLNKVCLDTSNYHFNRDEIHER
ncbi:MAG TPA: DUF104 domain-containing protein [Spirochaetes bacterium]|nr:DUF104 domain-containing protein [Spirochaetota bacterium]